MLERNIDDPTGIEGAIGSSEGLLYLSSICCICTTLHTAKQLSHGRLLLETDKHSKDIEVTISGYQIHVSST